MTAPKQADGRRKLSWDEMGDILRKYYKRKQWLKATKRYQKFHNIRFKKQKKKYATNKKYNDQKEHPEKHLAKRKFWVTKGG